MPFYGPSGCADPAVWVKIKGGVGGGGGGGVGGATPVQNFLTKIPHGISGHFQATSGRKPPQKWVRNTL